MKIQTTTIVPDKAEDMGFLLNGALNKVAKSGWGRVTCGLFRATFEGGKWTFMMGDRQLEVPSSGKLILDGGELTGEIRKDSRQRMARLSGELKAGG